MCGVHCSGVFVALWSSCVVLSRYGSLGCISNDVFDILMGQKWHTNIYFKFHLFPNFQSYFLINSKYSGQRFMFFFPKLDAFISIFLQIFMPFWSSFSNS